MAAAVLAVAPAAVVAEVVLPQVAALPQAEPLAAGTQGEEEVGVGRGGQPAAAVLLAAAALKKLAVRRMVAAAPAVAAVAAVAER